MRNVSRRQLLAAATAPGVLGAAGCLGGSTARYRLSASAVPGSLAERLRWEPRGDSPDADRALLSRLVEDGSLTTAGFVVLDLGRTQYVEHDGAFHEVTVQRTGSVERDHWIFWFDLLEGDPPGDAEVFTSSLGTGRGTDLEDRYGLSARDERAVEDAAGEIVREFDLHDPETDPPGRRGHVFLRRSESETGLLPEPPFTHVAFEVDGGTRYARAVTERATVELQQYTYRAEPVAETASAYAAHVREHHLEATFDRSSLSPGQQQILEAITTGGGRHEERAPISDAYATVLDRLGLDQVATPEPKRVSFSETAYFEYRDEIFDAELQIFG